MCDEEVSIGKGVVKFFHDVKGYGFIQLSNDNWEVEEGCKEIFVHQTKIKMDGRRTLVEDQHVDVEYHKEEKGYKADVVTPDAKWMSENEDLIRKASESRGDGNNRGGGGYDRGRGGYDDRNQGRYHGGGGGGYDRGGYGGGGGGYDRGYGDQGGGYNGGGGSYGGNRY